MFRERVYIPTLETERLILRKMTIEDADDLNEWMFDPEIYKYWGRDVSKGVHDAHLGFIDTRPNVKRKPLHDFLWGAVLKENGKVIGIIEVFDVENDRMGKIGYRISRAYQNRSLCSEAMRAVVDFIFTETKLDRLETTVNVENIPSNHVISKSGFTLEGTVRHGKMGTRYCDYNIYGMIREDYIK